MARRISMVRWLRHVEDEAMGTTAIERVLRHDRAIVAGGLLVVVALCWAYLLSGAGVMGGVSDASMSMGMDMGVEGASWTPGYALLMLLMWVVMMAAMMLPGVAPMLLLFTAITARRGAGQRRTIATGAFALGYIVTWAVFSLAAVALQFVLESTALLSPMMRTTHAALAGVTLIAAGIYQWTPLKRACLQHCRSPLDFVLTHWREGTRGAFEMGLRHGTYCVGCCWALMLLLFVVGVMNLAWIAGLAIFVLVEKFAPAGPWLERGVGVALMAWGLAILAMAVHF
ncbi:Predicted metal-binding membrane protein [Modicisalibacter muralis]|uniref:Predicted metal-binding membrane protein n=1 Tax=Modicisalibacter muralis TaxID=119000 RepID=A0A1G9M5C0_9GAMM|nr:DUF2182 domain-containing protein [Halomonas muralis]SDL68875.1 Predicted metal-binding membrane protein [Halomonas muralis]